VSSPHPAHIGTYGRYGRGRWAMQNAGYDGQRIGCGSGPCVLRVGGALGQGVPEVERCIGRSEHGRCVLSRGAAPTPGDEPIVGITEVELPIRDTCRQRVAVVEEPSRVAMQTDLVDAVRVGSIRCFWSGIENSKPSMVS
jgi:hypothetical protein